jgi:hypothetical protein
MHGVARRIVVATGACTQTTIQEVRPMMKGFAFQSPGRSHFSSFIFLQTILVCPVFESITVVTGRQLQVTVLAFSCLTTTQCSMSSAVGGGCWLRIGGGVAATGCFFAAQPARSRQNTSQAFLMPFVFALWCPVVDGNLGYMLPHDTPEKTGCIITAES